MGIKDKKGDVGDRLRPTEDLFPWDLYNHPVFCFKYLHRDYGIEQCEKEEKISLLERLVKLSCLSWDQIRNSHRHGFGSEKIDQQNIKPGIPPHVTPDVTFLALRFDGKKPMVGYKSHFVFHIVFIDRDFTVYPH